MKRRAPGCLEGVADRSRPVHGRHHRKGVFVVLSVATILAIVGLVLYSANEIASVLSTDVLQSPTWLKLPENGLEWQNALHQQSLENTPSTHGLAVQQVLFISCNRHDRSQAYWANIAVAAQCELVSRKDRAAAAPCRRLYAGQSPLRLDGAPVDESETVRRGEVPLGACGSVYDSSAAAQHRTAPNAATTLSTTTVVDREGDDAAGAGAGTSRLFPPAPLKVDQAPLDAVLWLGDAIYADKRADGNDGQSLLYQHVNTLAEVGRFWQIQRDAPVYNAFISSCVAVAVPSNSTTDSTTTATNTNTATAEVADVTEQPGHPAQLLAGTAGTEAEGEKLEEEVKLSTPSTTTHAGAAASVVADTALMIPQPSTAAGPLHNVWGTWDDHDMGKNDGGQEYPHKNVTQRFFLDFLKAPAEDLRWSREGVYEAYTLPFHAVVDNAKKWGEPLEALLRQLYVHAMCVVLLDVRSFRDPANASYVGDMLGEAQWAWFETQLQRFTTRTADGREPCAVTLIGGGIQFILDEKPAENWAEFPLSRDRLLGLLRLYRAERVAFLTGDVHMGELGGDFTATAVTQVLGYPLLEATSSGLTHSANIVFLAPALFPKLFPTPRRLALYVEKNFATARLSMDLLHLPRLRAYLNDTSEGGLAAESLLHTPEQRQSARAVVQRALNLTFTIFSIPRHGQPVHRLNFPLSMLTYADGPTYLDATVDAYRGDVHVRQTKDAVETVTAVTAAPAARTSIRLRNGTVASVAHYPVTAPAPFVTSHVRLAQKYIFTALSVSAALKRLALLEIGAVLLSLVASFVWVWRLVTLRRHTRLQLPHLSPVSPVVAHSGDLLSESWASCQQGWREWFRGLSKDKKR